MRARMLQHGLSADSNLRKSAQSADNNSLFWVAVALLALVIAFCGCATKQGTSAVHGDIARVQAHISEAQGQTDVIAQQNSRAAELAQRIHDKDVLIDRWRETHRK